MSKWVVDIHGDIEGDYEIIKKYDDITSDAEDAYNIGYNCGYADAMSDIAERSEKNEYTWI